MKTDFSAGYDLGPSCDEAFKLPKTSEKQEFDDSSMQIGDNDGCDVDDTEPQNSIIFQKVRSNSKAAGT